MQILVAYDVATEGTEGKRRLRHVANACTAFGQRVQLSVFECSLTQEQLQMLEHRLVTIIDQEQDSLRIYRLMEPRERYVKIYGRRPDVDFHGLLMS